MKKCPYCGEEIKDEAIKCRYCGSIVRGSFYEAKKEAKQRLKDFVKELDEGIKEDEEKRLNELNRYDYSNVKIYKCKVAYKYFTTKELLQAVNEPELRKKCEAESKKLIRSKLIIANGDEICPRCRSQYTKKRNTIPIFYRYKSWDLFFILSIITSGLWAVLKIFIWFTEKQYKCQICGCVWLKNFDGSPKIYLVDTFLKNGKGLVVSKVSDNSKALQAGIKVDDIIVRVCGEDAETARELKKILQSRDKMQSVKIELLRGENIIAVELNLDEDEKLGLNFK